MSRQARHRTRDEAVLANLLKNSIIAMIALLEEMKVLIGLIQVPPIQKTLKIRASISAAVSGPSKRLHVTTNKTNRDVWIVIIDRLKSTSFGEASIIPAISLRISEYLQTQQQGRIRYSLGMLCIPKHTTSVLFCIDLVHLNHFIRW